MSEHLRLSELLPLYISGTLQPEDRWAVENHLPECAECRADLALWKAVAGEVAETGRSTAAPQGLAERALAQVKRTPVRVSPLVRIFQLLRSQIPLVNREIWPASAAVIGLGYIVAVIAAHAGVINALAPLVAAGCVSLIYGPENDPSFELSLSTPTSPRQILLARLVLVFGYNLALVLVAALGLLPVLAQPLVGSLVLAWLAPMTFLTASALVLSMWVGAQNAISITYVAWLAAMLTGPLRSPQAGLVIYPLIDEIMSVYQHFWQAPALLLTLSVLLFAAAVWMVGSKTNLMNERTGRNFSSS